MPYQLGQVNVLMNTASKNASPPQNVRLYPQLKLLNTENNHKLKDTLKWTHNKEEMRTICTVIWLYMILRRLGYLIGMLLKEIEKDLIINVR